jgi:hypothetical protein
MATLLKVLNNLADIKSAGGVALRVRTQGSRSFSGNGIRGFSGNGIRENQGDKGRFGNYWAPPQSVSIA